MTGDPLDRIVAEFDSGGNLETRDMLALVEIARAARAWWAGKRPIDWTDEQHAEQPYVNCVGPQEQNLAAVLARLDGPR